MKHAALLRAQLLHILDSEPGHGYAAHKRATERGVESGRERTYRVLRAMESEGLVVSTQAPSLLGPTRRNYEVTDAGRAQLAELVAEAAAAAAVLNNFVRDAA